MWAGGVSGKAGLEASKAALLGLSGALTTGQNMGLAVQRGPRASTAAGGAVLCDLRDRGGPPWRGTMAAGHLGIGAALGEQPPAAAEPRCWNQRITKVVEALPHTQPAQARTRRGARP